ncbi:hypothetical protein ABT297_31185 [Dactylosporangium sp. NPDC000555]|uniref:hypothetical protein n=1 Tax=Dactylosporangium sp. NPDC000555 TaxID=3154260 RepID=UPI00332A2E7F
MCTGGPTTPGSRPCSKASRRRSRTPLVVQHRHRDQHAAAIDGTELRAVLVAAREDPWAGWACDGDAYWTPALVRQWWRDRGRLQEWITTKHRRWSDSDRADEREAAGGLVDYLAYLDGALQGHLQIYSYFLDNYISPASGDRLPSL